jgi:hypothetical protein
MFLTWLWVCFGASWAARDVGRAVAEPPWLMVDPHLIVLADGVDPRWLDPSVPARVEERMDGQHRPVGVYRAVRRDALPAPVAGLVGATVVVTGTDPQAETAPGAEVATCKVRISAIWAASVAPEEDDEGMTFFDGADAFGHVEPGWGWAHGHPLLVAEVAPLEGEDCARGALVAAPEGPVALRARRMVAAGVAKKVRASALKAVRATTYWGQQQTAYAMSLAAWRKEFRARQRAEPELDLTTEYGISAPKHWDEAARRVDSEAVPTVTALVDAQGVPQLIEVTLGNHVSCASPRSWFYLDTDYGIVDAGTVHDARAVLDWDGDGAWDLVEYGWSSGMVTALGHAHEPLQSFEVKARALYCPYEAVAPPGLEEASEDLPEAAVEP